MEDKILCIAMVIKYIQILTNNRKQIEGHRMTCQDIKGKMYLFANAEYLSVKMVTIREWIHKEILAHKIGKQWEFKFSELNEQVKSGQGAE